MTETKSADAAALPSDEGEQSADAAKLPGGEGDHPADVAAIPAGEGGQPADVAAPPGAEGVQPAEVAAPPAAEGGQQPTDRRYQKDGRYIPYGGGSLGWFENSGVLSNERKNNYAFRTAMEADLIRDTEHKRAGRRSEKRRSRRKVPPQELTVTLRSSNGEQTGLVVDLSAHGIRVSCAGEEVHLDKLEKIVCEFPASEVDVPPLELQCTVVRSQKKVLSRATRNVDLDFAPMSEEQAAALAELGGFDS